jgi:hypothetical protein
MVPSRNASATASATATATAAAAATATAIAGIDAALDAAYAAAAVATGGAQGGSGAGALPVPGATEDAYFDDPLRLPYVSIQYIESDDNSCLKRLQSIVQLGCPVDQTRDLKTLLYCTASGKMRCVAFLMDQGVVYSDTDSCMRVAALAVRYALESWTNIDSKKAREEMSWREKQGSILVSRGCPLFHPGAAGAGGEAGAGGAGGAGSAAGSAVSCATR